MKKVSVSPYAVFLLCISIYFGYGYIAAWTVLAALLHELGHVAVILLWKGKIEQISFGVTGAVIEHDPLSYSQEIFCAAAGPAVNLLLVALWNVLPLFAAVNLILFVYNMLPLYPLDGGRILRAGLLLKMAEPSACRIIRWINLVVCIGLMLISVCLAVSYRWGLFPIFLVAAVLCKTGFLAAKEGY